MLTIQPNFTRGTAFKGEGLIDQETYEEKRRFYEDQKEGYDRIINDENIPEGMKKGAKVFRVASEGILEGWAVAWGASHGSKMLKSGFTKFIASDFYKGLKMAAGSIGKIFKKAAGTIADKSAETMQKIKTSEFIQNMDQNKFGHYVIEGLRFVRDCFNFAVEKTENLYKRYVKGISYEKASGTVSKTLGVGAGLGGAYNAARGGNRPADAFNKSEDASIDDEADYLNNQYEDENEEEEV